MSNDIRIRLVVQTAGGKKEVKDFNASLDSMGDSAKQAGKDAGSSFKSMFSSAKKFIGVAGVAGIVYSASRLVRSGFNRMIDRGKEFESSLAELSAITGIAGSDLQELSKQALDASVEYGVAASDIIEANKLVASQLAQKIDFGTTEGMRELEEVSREAVVLARAAGIDLATAVNTTTTALNQFNLEASDTNRIINSIAAGSKFGAAEAQNQSDAYREAGSVFAAANRDFEELNASTQVLAANAIRGSRAGTGLRNMMTILQTESEKLAKYGIEDLNVQTNSWTETLHQLKPLIGDTAALADIFGRENLTVAGIMIQNADAVEKMNEQVRGTETAYEQAEIQMNTYEGAVQRLQSVIDSQLIPAFQEHNGVMIQGINLMADWVQGAGDAIRWFNRNLSQHALLIGDLRDEMDELNSVLTANNDLTKEQRDALSGSVAAMEAQLTVLREVQSEQILGTRSYLQTDRQIASLTERINTFNSIIATYTEKTAEATDQTHEFNESIEEETEKTANLSEQVKNLKDEYEELISQPSITEANLFRAGQIQQEIADIEELINKRKELTAVREMDEVDVSAEAEAEAEAQAEMERQRHAERMDRIEEDKLATLESERRKKEAQRETQEQFEDATRRIVASAAIRADSGSDVANTMIDSIFAEITALAIKSAMKAAPFPGNLLLAAGAAGTARGLRSLLPEFADGGSIRGRGGSRSDSVPIMASRGEYMLNARSTQAIGSGRMDMINRSPQVARAVGNMIDRLPHLARGGQVDMTGVENALKMRSTNSGSNRDILSAINAQTESMARMERKVVFNMTEFKDAEEIHTIQQQGLGRG